MTFKIITGISCSLVVQRWQEISPKFTHLFTIDTHFFFLFLDFQKWIVKRTTAQIYNRPFKCLLKGLTNHLSWSETHTPKEYSGTCVSIHTHYLCLNADII